jgi:chromosome segregation ATPase
MAAVRFDTLDYARKLERAGVPREQAALQAKALGEALAQVDPLHDDIARLDRRFDQVDARFAQVDARFDQVDARFEQLESKLDARIDALDVKLTGKIATLHWMFGTTVAMFAALFVQQFFSR